MFEDDYRKREKWEWMFTLEQSKKSSALPGLFCR